ncbi:AlpA family transcriptional regulator [Amycolatopsis sp. WQ 127309]|uniref:helix-turn-helix transcriptional regulator n=1 Tax=Amycolatopsis sp. WQ 127309 TaxID=2932773 RepID=UPI001FF24BF9|nr:helix-turn-helix domain-containing protein [Amycolatopsis sp. WQ 127309]UOZ07505.1 helix-turn-helix domain-containing protein [Amycolatopsis sp. WQ 127309]
MTVHVRVVELEGLWGPEELGAFLGIPEKTLRDWRLRGYGPAFIKLGKHVRYDPAVVRAWVVELSDSGEDDASEIPMMRKG